MTPIEHTYDQRYDSSAEPYAFQEKNGEGRKVFRSQE